MTEEERIRADERAKTAEEIAAWEVGSHVWGTVVSAKRRAAEIRRQWVVLGRRIPAKNDPR